MTYFYKINNEATKQIDFTQSKEMALAEGMLFETDESPEKGFDGLMYLKGFAPQAPDPTYAEKRVAEYPEIGDQLDAILKGFVVMRDSGVSLHPETNALIDYWQSVKEKYPKPNESVVTEENSGEDVAVLV